MAGRSAEAEKMTLGIISKTSNCIECYRLLSAIYSKQGNHTEVRVHVFVCFNSCALSFITPILKRKTQTQGFFISFDAVNKFIPDLNFARVQFRHCIRQFKEHFIESQWGVLD